MDRDLALIISGVCIKASREIGELSRIIPGDRKDLKLGISSVIHEIHDGIIGKIFDEFPEIKADMERRLKKYDRLI